MQKQILLLVFSFTLLSCQYHAPRSSKTCATWSRENVVYGIQQSIEKAQNALSRQEKRKQIAQGIAWAHECIEAFSDETSCQDNLAILEKLKKD